MKKIYLLALLILSSSLSFAQNEPHQWTTFIERLSSSHHVDDYRFYENGFGWYKESYGNYYNKTSFTYDGGQTWDDEIENDNKWRYFNFFDRDNAYCLSELSVSSEVHTLFKTTDGAETWEVLTDTIFQNYNSTSSGNPGNPMKQMTFFSENLFYGHTRGYYEGNSSDMRSMFYISHNGGQTFFLPEVNNLGSKFTITKIEFITDNVGYMTCYISGNDAKLMKTIDGGITWNVMADLNMDYRMSLGVAGTDIIYAVPKDENTLAKYEDGEWTTLNFPETFYSGAYPYIYMLNKDYGVFIFRDYGDFRYYHTEDGGATFIEDTINRSLAPGVEDGWSFDIENVQILDKGVAFGLIQGNIVSTVSGNSFLGIENSWKESVLMYPNPSSHTVHFKNLPKQSTITIINSLGQTVVKGTYLEAKQSFDISSLDNGIYFVKIQSGNAEVIKKLIVR